MSRLVWTETWLNTGSMSCHVWFGQKHDLTLEACRVTSGLESQGFCLLSSLNQAEWRISARDSRRFTMILHRKDLSQLDKSSNPHILLWMMHFIVNESEGHKPPCLICLIQMSQEKILPDRNAWDKRCQRNKHNSRPGQTLNACVWEVA